MFLNPLTPNDPFNGRTAPLTSKRCILYTYSTNIGTEYFKHGIYSLFFLSLSSKCSLFHNSNVFGFCIIHILYTGCAKIKKNNSGAKSSINPMRLCQTFQHYRHTEASCACNLLCAKRLPTALCENSTKNFNLYSKKSLPYI